MNRKEVVTTIACCGCFACYGLIINCFGIFFTSIYRDLGVSMASISATITVRSILTALFVSLFLPNLMRKIKINIVAVTGVLTCALGYFLLSRASSLPLIYVGASLVGLGMGNFTNFPITVIVKNWFSNKNGTMVGLIMAFSGIAGVVLNPICSSIIDTYGWRTGFLFETAFLLVVGVPSALMLKISPVERSKEELEAKRRSSLKINQLSILGIVLSTVICVAHTAFLGIANLLPSLSESMGHSLIVSGYIVSAAMVGNILSKLVIGIISDKTNPYFACMLILACALAGMVGIAFSGSSQIAAILFAVLFGCSYSVGTTGMPLLVRQVFGDLGYSAAYPLINFITLISTSVLTMLTGKLYDVFQTYRIQMILTAILGLAGVMVLFLMYTGVFRFPTKSAETN